MGSGVGDILWTILALGAATALIRWVARTKWFIRSVLRALRIGGPLPKHVACIMDGNRRWARSAKLQVHQGHAQGGEKLIEVLEWCLEADVKVVTVYAFSIENFKRTKEEVDAIMQLCERKFRDFLQNSDVVHKNRVRVRVLGDLTRISPSLRHLMNKVMASTMEYTEGPCLNICFSYACRYDIASSVAKVVRMCDAGEIQYEDINERMLSANLITGFANGASENSPYPEMLIRTSGETRLSDFLLWEGCFSVLTFCDSLWPDLTVWDFVKALLAFQAKERHRRTTISAYSNVNQDTSDESTDSACQLHNWSQGTKATICRLHTDYVTKLNAAADAAL